MEASPHIFLHWTFCLSEKKWIWDEEEKKPEQTGGDVLWVTVNNSEGDGIVNFIQILHAKAAFTVRIHQGGKRKETVLRPLFHS